MRNIQTGISRNIGKTGSKVSPRSGQSDDLAGAHVFSVPDSRFKGHDRIPPYLASPFCIFEGHDAVAPSSPNSYSCTVYILPLTSTSLSLHPIPSLEVKYGHAWESPCSSCMRGAPPTTVVAATSVASISSRVLGDKVVSRTERAPRANLNTRAPGQTVSAGLMQCDVQLLGNAEITVVGSNIFHRHVCG